MLNLGLEDFLNQFTKGNETLLMVAAFSLLVLLSFIIEMWVEIKKKDLKWNDITSFIRPIFFNTIFLFGLELLMIPAKRIPLGVDTVVMIQNLGWLGAMAYYFVGLYRNLKTLGLKISTRVDDAINDLGIQEDDQNKEAK